MLATVLGAILARTAALLGLLGSLLLATAPGTTAASMVGFVAFFDGVVSAYDGCGVAYDGCGVAYDGCGVAYDGWAWVCGCAYRFFAKFIFDFFFYFSVLAYRIQYSI